MYIKNNSSLYFKTKVELLFLLYCMRYSFLNKDGLKRFLQA